MLLMYDWGEQCYPMYLLKRKLSGQITDNMIKIWLKSWIGISEDIGNVKAARWYHYKYFFKKIIIWAFKVKLSLFHKIAIKRQPLIIQIPIHRNHFEWFWSFETYWQYHEKIFENSWIYKCLIKCSDNIQKLFKANGSKASSPLFIVEIVSTIHCFNPCNT